MKSLWFFMIVMMKMNKKGITLIELFVVMTIIAVLFAISMFAGSKYVKKYKVVENMSQVYADLNTLRFKAMTSGVPYGIRFNSPTEYILFKLNDKKSLEHITLDELVSLNIKPEPGSAILMRTGWDRMWDKPNFVKESPHFTKEAMEWLLDKNPSIIGGDIPCFDDPQNSEGLVKMLFEKGALILAPLVNLDEITKTKVQLIALPPKIEEVCACPCRAIVVE